MKDIVCKSVRLFGAVTLMIMLATKAVAAEDVSVIFEYLHGSDGGTYGGNFYLSSIRDDYVCVYPYVSVAVNLTGAVTPGPVRLSPHEQHVSIGQFIQTDRTMAWNVEVSEKWNSC